MGEEPTGPIVGIRIVVVKVFPPEGEMSALIAGSDGRIVLWRGRARVGEAPRPEGVARLFAEIARAAPAFRPSPIYPCDDPPRAQAAVGVLADTGGFVAVETLARLGDARHALAPAFAAARALAAELDGPAD